MDNDPRKHPVWNVYDDLRTARLNVKYYGIMLHKLKQRNFVLEVVLAFATSSTIAGLWLWETPTGIEIWKWVGLVAAVLAIIKPLLKWADKINLYSELLSGYRTYYHDLHTIKKMVDTKLAYDSELKNDYSKALQLKGSLVIKDPDSKHDSDLVNKLMAEVQQELPVGGFFIPN